MKKSLYFLFACLLTIASCTTAQIGNTGAASEYTPMNSVSYYADEDTPLFVSLRDTVQAVNHLVANTPVMVIGHKNSRWYVLTWRERRYYTRVVYLHSTPVKRQYTPVYSTPSSTSRSIQTGPRGGRYYINKNGNRTYIKRR